MILIALIKKDRVEQYLSADEWQVMLIAVKLYERLVDPVFLGWLFMFFFLTLLLYSGRSIIALVLFKLHEIFIQRNIFLSSGRLKGGK
mgnify:CR=1 FL=1